MTKLYAQFGGAAAVALGRGGMIDVNKTLKESEMRKLIGGLAVVALLAGVLATPAAAQIHGNATYAAMPGTGVTISGDFGMGLNDDAKWYNDNDELKSPMYIGGRIGLGLEKFGVWAGAGGFPIGISGASAKVGFGGGAGFHVLSGPEMPVTVSIQAGAGYYKYETEKNLIVPFGALIAINIPTTGVGVTPWIYPRGEYYSFKESSLDISENKVGFGVSGGLMVTLPMGVGLQGTLDWKSIKFGEGTDAVTWKPMVVSFGLHYKIKVPSLGM